MSDAEINWLNLGSEMSGDSFMVLIKNTASFSGRQQISLSLNTHMHTLNPIQFWLNLLITTNLCGLKTVPSL